MRTTRKLVVVALTFATLASVGGANALFGPRAQARPQGWSLPERASEVASQVFDIGTSVRNGRTVQGFAIVDYAAGHARPPGAGGGGKKGGGSSGYTFLANGAKWKAAEGYVVDPSVTHTDGTLSAGDIANIEFASVGLWETAAADAGIFGAGSAGAISPAARAAIGASANGVNEVVFDDIDEPGVIAVTFVWGIFSGSPKSRQLLEWDQIFDDDGDFTWGDATVSGSAVMDFFDICAHEVGHAFGLGHPDATYTEETMYAYATEGETKKRDLHDGDIAGIRALYK